MRFSKQTIRLLAGATVLFLPSTESFSLKTSTIQRHAGVAPSALRRRGSSSSMNMSSPSSEQQQQSSDEKIAALRAAAEKARKDAERLRQELGESSSASSASTAVATTVPKKSPEQVKAIVPTLLSETADLGKQLQAWQELKDSQSVTAFNSANLRTFPVSLSMLEQRTSLTATSLGIDADGDNVNLDDFKYATLFVVGGCSVLGVASLALLPPNIGATVCYLLALIPVLFLGIGSTAPATIANAIAAIKGGGNDSDSSAATPSAQERICRHEAAHFCAGYWCGLPIAGYSVQEGVARVEFAAAAAATGRGYSNTQVAALTVTALAGLVGEAMTFEKALPGTGTADLAQLETGVFRQSSEFIGAQQQQDLTRWGALTSSLLLRQNAAAYEKVVEAFSRQAPLEECIALLEE